MKIRILCFCFCISIFCFGCTEQQKNPSNVLTTSTMQEILKTVESIREDVQVIRKKAEEPRITYPPKSKKLGE